MVTDWWKRETSNKQDKSQLHNDESKINNGWMEKCPVLHAKSLNVTKGWFRVITSNPNYKLDQNGSSAISRIFFPNELTLKKIKLLNLLNIGFSVKCDDQHSVTVVAVCSVVTP